MTAYDINFDIDFNQIWKSDEIEEADIKLKNSQRGQIDITSGVRQPDQVRKENYPELAEEILPTIPEQEDGDDILEAQQQEGKLLSNAQNQ